MRKYLENPIIDPEVERDEVDRNTTVEHVKLLRDHLKETITNTESRGSENVSMGERRISELREEIKEEFSNSYRIISELRNEMNEKFARVLEVLEVNRISSLREGEPT